MSSKDWVVDVEGMACRNAVNRITVRFADMGSRIEGRIDDVPLALLSALTRRADGAAYLVRQVGAAEGVFVPELLRARMAV
jgi:hypothetical protein